jgi:anti-sigma regulatory factor (Ser/Thr protein kinase)
MSRMSQDGRPMRGSGHAVRRYSLDSEGIEAVARFIAHGWSESDSALIIASAHHRERIDAAMSDLGVDPELMAAQGRYVTRDADATLRRFVDRGVLQPQRFRAVVQELLTTAGRDGAHVRVFSELMALLRHRDEVTTALELEFQWRALLREGRFSLLCAYPAHGRDSGAIDVRRVCDLHTELLTAASSPGKPSRRVGGDSAVSDIAGGALAGSVAIGRYHACSRVFLPVAESVPAARHFVVNVLHAWGLGALDVDAAIVASELATNAVTHADSPFRATLDRQHDGVRIGVEDAGHDSLARRSPDTWDLGGRGVVIVEALSQRWGSTELPSGKLVWAELVAHVDAASAAG